MIHDVDESLRALVRREVLNEAGIEVSFEAPTRDWSTRRNAPALNIYLYEIREDLTRRRAQFEEARDNGGFVTSRRLPPRLFKLSYLITAWTQRPEDEHRLLSAVLSCFIGIDALPTEVLQGDLVGQPEAVRVTIALPLAPDRSITDVWTALGGELKPSLDLVVTCPFDTSRHMYVGAPVMEQPRIGLRGIHGPVEDAGGDGDGGKAGGGGGKPGQEGRVGSEGHSDDASGMVAAFRRAIGPSADEAWDTGDEQHATGAAPGDPTAGEAAGKAADKRRADEKGPGRAPDGKGGRKSAAGKAVAGKDAGQAADEMGAGQAADKRGAGKGAPGGGGRAGEPKPTASEVVRGGKGPQGRKFTIEEIPRE